MKGRWDAVDPYFHPEQLRPLPMEHPPRNPAEGRRGFAMGQQRQPWGKVRCGDRDLTKGGEGK